MATVNYSASVVLPGFAGATSATKNAARLYGLAGRTSWCGIITGTAATITATSDFGANANLIAVSVDGGNFVSASVSGGVYTLFTGLADVPHTVCFVFGSAFSSNAYVLNTGNRIAVTGATPDLFVFSNWAEFGVTAATHAFSGAAQANITDYLPATLISVNAAAGSNVSSLRLAGTFNYLAISTNSTYVFVSIDGASPTRYTTPTAVSGSTSRPIIIAAMAGAHIYNIWGIGRTGIDGLQLSASGDSAATTITAHRMDQYGDSITFGAGSTTPGDVETMRVAAHFLRVGSTVGRSGSTAVGMDAVLSTVLAARTVTSNDVAIIALGRNAPGASFDAGEIAAYNSCITKLQSAGYGKILCRGVLPEGANLWPDENAKIQAIVTSRADANVIFVDVSTWLGIATADFVHPTDAGYATMAPYAIASYPLFTAVNDAIIIDARAGATANLILDDLVLVNDAIELNASLHVSPNLILNDLILVNDSIDLNAFISASSLLLLDDYSTELVSDSIELNASVRASPILSLSDSVLVDFAIDNALYLVEERLINAFIAGAPALFGGRIKYPNAEFSTPNNLTWAQVFAPASFGPISTDASGCYEINQGQMVVSLFCPRGTGTRLIGAAAHEVKQLFGADNFEDVTITSVVVSPAPEPSSSPWYGINIVISFQYEGHRS